MTTDTGLLVAGRALDALVAERVMGWHLESKEFGQKFPLQLAPLITKWWCDARGIEGRQHQEVHWNPSTSIAAAWTVVEKLLQAQQYPFTLMEDRYTGFYASGLWLCSFEAHPEEFANGPHADDCTASEYWADPERLIVAADTAPLAICLAALKVQGD